MSEKNIIKISDLSLEQKKQVYLTYYSDMQKLQNDVRKKMNEINKQEKFRTRKERLKLYQREYQKNRYRFLRAIDGHVVQTRV